MVRPGWIRIGAYVLADLVIAFLEAYKGSGEFMACGFLIPQLIP